MKSMFSLSAAVAAILAGSCVAKHPVMDSRLIGRQANVKYEGCYSSAGSLKFNATATWQSRDKCHDFCAPMNMAVEATTNSNACWCGNALPPNSSLVDDNKCDVTCSGYPYENCGSANTFSVYLTGVGTLDTSGTSSSSSSSSSTSSPTASAPASVVTLGGQTVVVTTGPSASAVAHSTNKAAIAAGVVVGLLAFIALAGGGAYLYMRRRKIRQVEEEYRRNAAVSEFVAGGKTHSSSNGSFSDTRLDPTVMAQRRMSDGSIADNQDYSRRILKVTNA